MTEEGLQNAAAALDVLAQGRVPDRAQLLSGALALDTLKADPAVAGDRDLMDAVLGLEELATGGTLDLDDVGRARAADLARKVRELAEQREPN